ncbi:MAG: UDP-N-acetylmuramate dehydrogenase [Sediminibacterium sp.]|nr:UDP-N-acetylmuramate dehydrogenase [Chitinophagaceae bacterium]MCA6445695.1 UDP-N-acetylmuramate dehydrogenase [Chitinophagaceae bacterium]
MQIAKNISLKPFNSFGIEAIAAYYSRVDTAAALEELLQEPIVQHQKILVLGGGSNLLFTKDVNGLVIHNQIRGIHIIHETNDIIYLKVMAGEPWHELVQYCVAKNWGGIENLSLIPGNTGAAPIQNIGAYGVEIKDVIHEVEAIQLSDGKKINLSNTDCAFGYRDSIFKNELKHSCIITAVTIRLTKNPTFNTSYGAINTELEKMKVSTLSISAISQAVINIRSSKLPDPSIIGNAGSFFKNPIISKTQYLQLLKDFPTIPSYSSGENIKIPAGWLIEQCGWKGYRKGDAGCYDKQALVLVNYGNASGADIYELSTAIIQSVQTKFGIYLEREVNIL